MAADNTIVAYVVVWIATAAALSCGVALMVTCTVRSIRRARSSRRS